ncbi:hypothetical protein KC723_02125 [Candidatus Kaiserbacteria bacterium]|nr:hypothetical protein [Candidatus Kaiserbacteria bacterium]
MSKPWPERSSHSNTNQGKTNQFSPRTVGSTKPPSFLDKIKALPETKRNFIALGTAGVATLIIASFWGVSKIYGTDEKVNERSSVFGSGLLSVKDQLASVINAIEETVPEVTDIEAVISENSESTLQEKIDGYRQQNTSPKDVKQNEQTKVITEEASADMAYEISAGTTTDNKFEKPSETTSHIGRPVLIATTSATYVPAETEQ